MAKPTSPNPSRSLAAVLEQAQAAVAGRLTPDIDALFDLIHAVNPTARDLAAEHRAERYRLKSQLQSLLIRRHPAVLQVQFGGGRVVGLLHRVSRRDACHAVLDDLADDARAWVQFRIDTGEVADLEPAAAAAAMPSTGGSAARAEPNEAESWLQRGETALAEYDFEAARTALAAAVVASGGSPGTGLPLIELLVDTLGEPGAALEWAPRLQRRGRGSGTLCAYLGIAAVQSGDLTAAEDFLADASGALAARAWTELAEAALALVDLDLLQRAMAAARRAGPPSPALLRLEAKLQALREQVREPAEAELRALWQAQDWPGLERRARTLLAEHPDSALARKALRHLEQQDLAARQAAAIQQARAAMTAGDWQLAVELLQAAPERSGEAGALLEMARQVRRLRQVAERVEMILEHVDRGDEAVALAALWDARDPDVSAGVRDQWSSPLPAWLETLQNSEYTRDQAVQAALAMQAVTALPPGEQAQAAAERWGALPALQALPGAVRLYQRHCQAQVARERNRQEQQLRAAQELVDREEWLEARQALDDLPALSGPLALLRDAMAQQVAAGLALHRLEQRYTKMVQEDNWVEAAHLAGALAQQVQDPGRRDHWLDCQNFAQSKGLAALQVIIEDLAPGVPPLLPLGGCVDMDDQVTCINPLGQVALVTGLAGRYFVELLDPATSLVIRRARFNLGDPNWAGITLATVYGVVLPEVRGTVLVLDPVTLRPTRQFRVPLRPSEFLKSVVWPEPSLLWLGAHDPMTDGLRWQVLDLDTLAPVAALPQRYLSAQHIPGLEPPGLLLRDLEQHASVVTSRGRPHAVVSPPATCLAGGACVSPHDPRVVLVAGEFKGGENPGHALGMVSATGSKARVFNRFAVKEVTKWHAVQSSSQRGKVYALAEVGERAFRLLTITLQSGTEAAVAIGPASNHSALAASHDGRTVYLLVGSTRGTLVETDPAQIPAAIADRRAGATSLAILPHAAPGYTDEAAADRAAVEPLLVDMVHAPYRGGHGTFLPRWLALPKDADRLLLMGQALRRRMDEVVRELQPGLATLAQRHPPAWLHVAALHASFEDWPAAHGALQQVVPAELTLDQAKHHRHLQTFVAIGQADLVRAQELLALCAEDGEPEQPCGCALNYWREAVQGALALRAGEQCQGYGQLLARVVTAGHLAEAGDGPQARSKLDELSLAGMLLEQFSARCALAWLVDPQPRSPCDRFAEAFAMAAFVGSRQGLSRHLCQKLLLPGDQWSAARLAELAEQARVRLAEMWI